MIRRSRGWQIKCSRRGLRKWHKAIVRRRRGPTVWIDERVSLASSFNFSQSYSQTVQSLLQLKRATLVKPPAGHRRRVHIDLASMEEVSVAGALVLAAEIDRWRRLKRAVLAPRDTESWNPSVKRMLTSLGFFRLLGVELAEDTENWHLDKEVVVLQMVTDARADGEMIWEIGEHLSTVASVFEQDPVIYAALVEAAYNSTLHGYPEGYEYEFKPIRKRWWATACWYPHENVVRFLVYDQGVGIAATLPRSRHWESVRNLLSKLPVVGGLAQDSSSMIEAAIEVCRTSRSGGHGKGLSDVVAPIKGLRGARVRILSGRGSYICYGDGRIEKGDNALSLGGTLIEWTIPTGSGHVE